MWTQVGACPKCGAPIYAPSVWHGVLPPPPHHSCGCNGGLTTSFTTSTDTTPAKARGEQADAVIDALVEVVYDLRRAIESEATQRSGDDEQILAMLHDLDSRLPPDRGRWG